MNDVLKFKTTSGRIASIKKASRYSIRWNNPSRSKFQTEIKKFLKQYWQNDIVFEEIPMVGSRLSFDFYNASKKIICEPGGEQHFRYVPHFHRNIKAYLAQLRRDDRKMKFCAINNITLVEIFPDDVKFGYGNYLVSVFEEQGVKLL